MQGKAPEAVLGALRRVGVTVVTALSALAFAGVALAQDAAAERSQGFKAVQGAVQEDVPGGPLLVIAYGLIWVMVLVYVLRLMQHQQRTAAELERVESLLRKGAGEQG